MRMDDRLDLVHHAAVAVAAHFVRRDVVASAGKLSGELLGVAVTGRVDAQYQTR
jgi:hypothetical protein